MSLIKPTDDCKMSLWDRLGISTSALCVVHCLLISVLLLVLPQLADQFFHLDIFFHLVILFLVFIIAGLAIYKGYRLHKKIYPSVLFVIGLAIVSYASTVAHGHFDHTWITGFTIVGSLFLIKAHISNHFCSKCKHHDHNH